jgi:aerobic C4-dicarboxylate transport protein
VLSFYAVVAIFIAVVLGTICALFKINLFRFLGYIKDEIYIVLGTASSESVLPRLLEKLPKFGCSKQSVGLVLPTGYAFNLDGTSIYMSTAYSSSPTRTMCRSISASSSASSP